MMNKVLISLYVPSLDVTYDVFIPVNEVVWKISKLLVTSISNLVDADFSINNNYVLVNIQNGKIYNNNEIIINTDIRNSAKIMLLEI